MAIIQTGNWEWRSGFDSSAVPSGDCASNPMTCTSFWYGNIDDPTAWGFGYDGYNHLSLDAHDGTLQFEWSETGLYLDGVATDPQDLPVGFRVHDAYHFALATTGPPASANMHLNIAFTTLALDEDIFDFGVPHIYDRLFSGFGDDSLTNLLAFLSIGGWQMLFTADNPAYPTWSGTNFKILTSLPPKFYGVYDIVYWWWKLPDVTSCGDRNTRSPLDSDSHLVYAGEQPPTPDGAFGEFEKLDPDDFDAAPTPVILSLVPNHGQPGTRVQILGEGFGDDANVQFDGVDAEDIEVVSQYQILATAPSHALGYTNVAVINPDGVSS